MKVIIFLFVVAVAAIGAAIPSPQALDKTGCEMNCQKCHSVTIEEIREILNNMKTPEVEVLKVEESPVKGLWEVSISNKGQPGLFYLGFAKSHLISGSLTEVSTGKNKTMEKFARLQESRRIEFSKIPLHQALVIGDTASPKKVAVFTDPDCPHCSNLHQEMEKVLLERKDIAFYVILFPLSIHPDAYWKSKSIVCKKSITMLADAFAQKTLPKPDCDTDQVDVNIRLAEALGITGTPVLVLPDGRVHSGTMSADRIIDFVDGVRPNKPN
jgi:thiol:disulfide interchange protein DsbC